MSLRITVPDNANVQVIFEMDHPVYGRFQDAVYYTPAEWMATPQSERLAAQQARYDDWVYMIENPPAPEPVAE